MAGNNDSKALEKLIGDLQAAHGDNLASVVLYGSAAAGDQLARRSDRNLLIALKRITTEDLHAAEAPLRQWRKQGQPIPVYFTVGELQDAADVFPIEFMQMEKARKVLFGQDPFEFVHISHTNLRHQTEYELRTKLIRLRRLYIPASNSLEKLSRLMGDSLSSFAALFRAVLILLGQEPPIAKRESVRATVRALELDGQPFERIFELRSGDGSELTEEEASTLFTNYMDQIERVISAVDRLTDKEAT
jgi:hypothetical protein